MRQKHWQVVAYCYAVLSNLGAKLALQRLRALWNCRTPLLGEPALKHREKTSTCTATKGERRHQTPCLPGYRSPARQTNETQYLSQPWSFFWRTEKTRSRNPACWWQNLLDIVKYVRLLQHTTSPGPASSKAEHVFLVSTHTKCSIHIYIGGYPDQHRPKSPITHTNMNGTDGPVLFLLFCWAALKSTSGVCAHVYAHKVWIPPAAGAGCSVRPLTLLALGPLSLSPRASHPCGQRPPLRQGDGAESLLGPYPGGFATSRGCSTSLDTQQRPGLVLPWHCWVRGFPLLLLLCSFAFAAVSP